MKTVTLVPAYGRDYDTQKRALEAFRADRDFMESKTLRYCNRSDLITYGVCRVYIRYKNLKRVFEINM